MRVVIYLLYRTDRVFYLLTLSPYTYGQRPVSQHKQVTHLNIFMFKRITIMKDCFVIFLDYYFANTCMWSPNTLIHIRYSHTDTYALHRVI